MGNSQGYSERGKRNATNQNNQAFRYDFSALDDVATRFQQKDKENWLATDMAWDRNHQLMRQKNPGPDGGELTWLRDYFGNATQHTNLSKQIFDISPDFKQQITRQKAHGPTLTPLLRLEQRLTERGGIFNRETHIENYLTEQLGDLQHLHFNYRPGGGLLQAIDKACKNRTDYRLNSQNQRISLAMWDTSVADKPTLVRQVTERLDNQGREREVFDTGALFITGFDNENNRTYLQGIRPRPDGTLEAKAQGFKLDGANRVTDVGLIDKEKFMTTLSLGYENGLRVREIQGDSHTNILYDDDSVLTETINEKLRTTRQVTNEADGSHYHLRETANSAALPPVKRPLWEVVPSSSLDFSTPKNGAIFYSGADNRQRAKAYAKATGKKTIEKTPGGKALKQARLYDHYPTDEADAFWQHASHRFASLAQGDVTVFAEDALPERTFAKVELPALRKNPYINQKRAFQKTAWEWANDTIPFSYDEITAFDLVGVQTASSITQNDKLQTNTIYSEPSSDHRMRHLAVYDYDSGYIDNLAIGFTGTDSWQQTSVGGVRTGNHSDPIYSLARLRLDANGNPNSKTGAPDSTGRLCAAVVHVPRRKSKPRISCAIGTG